MALIKLRRAIDLVKDQTSIGLAKLNNNSSTLSDLEVAIVKATRHEEYPPEDKHIKEILCLTTYARGHVGSCVRTIARRLSRTKNWIVALKTLMLIHRLLNDGNSAYEQEIFFATRRGTRLLNMSDFRAMSTSNSWDYSAFVRTYALYLDEMLDNRMQGKRGKHSSYSYRDESDEESYRSRAIVLRSTPIHEMKFDQLILKTNHLVQIIERFLACRPTGHARTNSLVLVALYPIVKESFRQYYELTEMLGNLIDRFMELNIPESIKVHEIFCRCAKQFDEVYSFYGWTKTMGIARRSEYPKVEHISEEKLQVMDEFIRENIDIQKSSKAIEDKIVEEIEIGPEPDMNSVKALPPPEGFPIQRREKGIVEVKTEEEQPQETMGDLLNLGDHAPRINDHEDQLALALFDGIPTTTTTTTGPPPWVAFKDSSDWETALVQSASYLSNQHAELPHGFNTSVLDAMYDQRGVTTNQYTASSGFIGTGSASSVALGAAPRPTMLALPTPHTQYGLNNAFGIDPFAPSYSIPPPPYVQIHEMEMKQRKLVEEQLIWQQYTRDGMHGQMAFGQMQPNPYYYNTGGNTQTF
ncbi:vesicle coat protein [Lithospermum erythrorhizon]|uniref:Vesicle coat protein n=1 Tax=Lithospermum erythrorhizon TaxID=34254 RepID=A0AAV3QAF7_LITER